MSVDNGGISTSHLSHVIRVQWRTAQLMFRMLRHSMGERDQTCLLRDLIEMGNVFIGTRRTSWRERDA